jgi:membrane associated rhomboid family serine protease
MVAAVDIDAPSTVCYRHPDRPTRVSCSECGRPICVECMRDSAVGQKCPECAAPVGRGRVIDARRAVQVSRATSPVALGLIAVNVVIFVIGRLSGDLGDQFFREGAMQNILVGEFGEWYRGFTSMFLHADLLHILFNMYALWLFGPVLERRFGSVPFALLYVASGLGGSALFFLAGDPRSSAVGASGAIFGLFGALLAASYRQRHTPAGRVVFGQLGVLLAINLALPLLVPRIAWEAHVGGLVVGILVAAVWDRLPLDTPRAAIARAAVAGVPALAALLILILA